MRTFLFETLLNVALGIAWVLTLAGAFFAFSHFYGFGLLFAIITGLFGAVPGIFMVLSLEFMMNFAQLRKNSEKQARLLEEISKKLGKSDG